MTDTPKTQQNQSSLQAWVVCLVGALYFFYIFIQMTKFNAIGQQLMSDFRMNSAGLGTLSSIFFWGDVLFLFPAGLILDRYSIKKSLLLMMVVVIVCTFAFSLTHSLTFASWCFFFTGIAGAFGLMVPLRLASHWFPAEKMALVSGLSVTIGFLGAMVSQSPLTWLVGVVGWRHAMQWDAGLGILFFVMFLLVIKDSPVEIKKEVTVENKQMLRSLWGSIKHTIVNRQNWLFGIYTCLLNMPIFILGAVFGVNYLQQVQHLTIAQASFANVLLFAGAMAGSPFFGWFSDKMKRRKFPMYVGGIVTLILLLTLMYGSWNYMVIYALFTAIGFFTSAQVITYPVIAESNFPENIATGFGMGSSLIMSGGAFLIPLFGILLQSQWDKKILNGMPWHSVSDYRFALWMLPISAIIGMIAIKFGKETKCKSIVVSNDT
ncbi:MAG: MFS transporter [Gammaproteobacteria bacterium]|nr:MFS transporter [Gammaproteobacteria bacterium]